MASSRRYPKPSTVYNLQLPFPDPGHLAPLQPPPVDAKPPFIPPSRGAWIPGWTRTTHVCPAAYPRRSMLPQPTSKITTKQLFQRRMEDNDGRYHLVEPRGEVLWTVAERYARTNPAHGRHKKGLTLVCTHANGLHKETWDVALERLLLTGNAGHLVDEIWTIDCVVQGDGCLVNAANLPDICKHTRAITHCLPDAPNSCLAGERTGHT
jgi:hypothetical protein